MVTSFHMHLLVCSLFVLLASAVPHWDGFVQQASFHDLAFSGANPVEALLSVNYHRNGVQTMFLSVVEPGKTENLTVTWPSKTIPPPHFLINKGHLFHFHNESAIYPVNLLNVTKPGEPEKPLQMVLGNKKGVGFNGGYWRWQGSMLYYEYDRWGNQGIYYRCPTTEMGIMGLFTSLSSTQTPEGCDSMTLHSFTRDTQGRRRALTS